MTIKEYNVRAEARKRKIESGELTTDQKMKLLEQDRKELEEVWKELNSIEWWIPALKTIPLPWLILGICLILFGWFTMFI